MRWVLNYRPNVKWYLFQDDDVYIRGPALVALLSRYDPDRAMSISGHNNLRGFAPGMWPVYREKGCLSNSQCTFMFPWMQPAAFSRAALKTYGARDTTKRINRGVHGLWGHARRWIGYIELDGVAPDGHPPKADHGHHGR